MSEIENERLQVSDTPVNKGVIPINAVNVWDYTKQRNALIAGNVGTGKTSLLLSIIGQLLTQTSHVTIADTKGADLSQLAHIDDLKEQVFSDFEGTLKAIGQFYDEMLETKKKAIQSSDDGFLMLFPENKPHFLVIDELNYFVEYGNNLEYGTELYKSFHETMSKLVQIGLVGSGFGCYLIISSSLPSAEYLSVILRNQLTLRINMGRPTASVEAIMFSDNHEILPRFPKRMTGLGYLQTSDLDVIPFRSPKIPKDFDLHDYINQQIAKRTS
ncbi:FtsK/SpoIIIE domain-containing protein [Leuconostoc pseudomesenteroides]|uniref:FtsK/SpoIIIE domain-containing protein n=1 Tax=Leuconostoc pseudomesenteroides TaxID=33968 RepID=UPI0032DEB3E9